MLAANPQHVPHLMGDPVNVTMVPIRELFPSINIEQDRRMANKAALRTVPDGIARVVSKHDIQI